MSPRVIAFIVGTSRGGTTWLSKVLNCHPDVASFGETGFFGRYWQEPGADGRLAGEQVRQILDGALRGRYGPDVGDVGTLQSAGTDRLRNIFRERLLPYVDTGGSVADVFDAFAGAFGVAEGKPLLVEKTPHHVNHVGRILGIVPDAKFIVTLRDPYAFMRSYKFQGQQYGTESRARSARLYHPIVCALLWRRYFRSVAALEREHPDRMLRFDVGQIADGEQDMLDRLQVFLGLRRVELAGKVPRDNSSFPNERRQEIGPADIWWMNRIAGREIREGGWSLRQAPVTAAVGPAVKLPVWLARNVGHLRRAFRGNPLRHAMRLLRR